MSIYEVRELNEWHNPYRWAVHKDGMPMNLYASASEAYAHMNGLIDTPGLYCKVCCARLMVKDVYTVFCPNKGCEK